MPLSEERIKIRTKYSEDYVPRLEKRIAEYKEDSRKEARESIRECKTCFYLKGGIAGSAMTKYKCGNCEKEDWHQDTNTPRYCRECADKHKVCVRCGSRA